MSRNRLGLGAAECRLSASCIVLLRLSVADMQAMMELGACICTGQRAACADCPLQASCAAFSSVKEHHAAEGPLPSVLDYPAKVTIWCLLLWNVQSPQLVIQGKPVATLQPVCEGRLTVLLAHLQS